MQPRLSQVESSTAESDAVSLGYELPRYGVRPTFVFFWERWRPVNGHQLSLRASTVGVLSMTTTILKQVVEVVRGDGLGSFVSSGAFRDRP